LHERQAFHGLCLVIVRGIAGRPGSIKLKATSGSLKPATMLLHSGA
jgi:hypothetical protein